MSSLTLSLSCMNKIINFFIKSYTNVWVASFFPQTYQAENSF